MENDCYWNLFWQTGLPEAWLMGCVNKQAETAPESVSDVPGFLSQDGRG